MFATKRDMWSRDANQSERSRRSAAGIVGGSGGCDRRRRKPQTAMVRRCNRRQIDFAGNRVGAAGEQRADWTQLIAVLRPRVIRCVLERFPEVLERMQFAPELHADKQQ